MLKKLKIGFKFVRLKLCEVEIAFKKDKCVTGSSVLKHAKKVIGLMSGSDLCFII